MRRHDMGDLPRAPFRQEASGSKEAGQAPQRVYLTGGPEIPFEAFFAPD